MPKSKDQKRLEALERRKLNYVRHIVILGKLYPEEILRRAHYEDKADKSAADIVALSRKLNIPTEDITTALDQRIEAQQ